MIEIVPCTSSDYAAVAALWNARRLDAASCWSSAEEVDEGYIAQLAAAGMALVLAVDDGLPAGFGLWYGPPVSFRLVALAAEETPVYYRLMIAYCDAGIAIGASDGFAELGATPTTERARMDALGVIDYVTTGYEPLAPGQPPEERVPRLLRAECNLAVLKQAAEEYLEGEV